MSPNSTFGFALFRRYLCNTIQDYESLSKVDKARMVLELSGTDEQTGKLVYNIICARLNALP